MTREDRLQKAKDTSIVDYLSSNGISFKYSSGSTYFYHSFFGSDSNPSLAVRSGLNKFKDFSSGKSGDLIDIVMHIEGLDMWSAIDMINSETSLNNIPKYEKKDTKPGIDVVKVDSLDTTGTFLPDYLRSRRVDVDIASIYCKQAYIKFPNSKINPHKEHKVLAFRNDKGGYEFRNDYIKKGNSPKYFTCFRDWKSQVNSDRNGSVTFEGFMDFLSFVSRYKIKELKWDTYILNGVSNLIYLLETYKHYPINRMYLDNDKAGSDCLKILQKENINYEDRRNEYEGYKDYNEAWKEDFRRTKALSTGREKIRRLLLG